MDEIQMSDLTNLYDIIWDTIESGGNFSYVEVIGTLEMIKQEIIEEALRIRDETDLLE